MVSECYIIINKEHALVIQRLDSAIQRISLYTVDSAVSFPSTDPLYSDLSVEKRYPMLGQLGQRLHTPLAQLGKKVQLLTLNKIWLQSTFGAYLKFFVEFFFLIGLTIFP